MKQTRQQKLVWVEIKQKRFMYANVQKTDSRWDNKAPRSKRACLAKEYIKHVHERPNCQCVYKIHYEFYYIFYIAH